MPSTGRNVSLEGGVGSQRDQVKGVDLRRIIRRYSGPLCQLGPSAEGMAADVGQKKKMSHWAEKTVSHQKRGERKWRWGGEKKLTVDK